MNWRQRLRDERGFTLMELIVAMALGIIVIGALFAISEEGLRLTVRTGDQVDANQQGRTAIEQIESLLHSSCVIASSAPIQATSNSTQLVFVGEQTGVTGSAVAGADSGAILNPSEYVISYSGGQLTEYEYALNTTASTASEPTTWQFSTTAELTRVLLTHAGMSTYPAAGQPIFQYYEYNSSGELPLLESLNGTAQAVPYSSSLYYYPGVGVPLTTTTAPDIAAVSINFVAFPYSNTAGTAVSGTSGDRTVDVTDSVVLRFTTASTAVVNDVPCE